MSSQHETHHDSVEARNLPAFKRLKRVYVYPNFICSSAVGLCSSAFGLPDLRAALKSYSSCRLLHKTMMPELELGGG